MFTKLGALASGACPLERRTILLLTKSGCGGMSTQTAPEIAEFDFLLEVPGKQTPVLIKARKNAVKRRIHFHNTAELEKPSPRRYPIRTAFRGATIPILLLTNADHFGSSWVQEGGFRANRNDYLDLGRIRLRTAV